MALELPSDLRLEPFVIDEWQFESVHRMSRALRRETGLVMRRYLAEVIELQRPRAAVCTPHIFYADRSAAYFRFADAEEAAGRPRPSWEQFLPTYVTGIDDSAYDPNTYSLLFALREHQRSDEIIGAFTLYNMVITSSNPGRVTASGYPAPGYPIKDQTDKWGERLSRIIRFLLSSNLDLEDGRLLRLDEMVFPTDDEEHRWENAPAVTRLLAESRQAGHSVERKNEKLRRIRR